MRHKPFCWSVNSVVVLKHCVFARISWMNWKNHEFDFRIWQNLHFTWEILPLWWTSWVHAHWPMASTGICHICLKPHYQLSDSAEEIETKETTHLGKSFQGFGIWVFFVTQGTFVHIPPNGRRKIIFKRTLRVGYVSSQEGMPHSFSLGSN